MHLGRTLCILGITQCISLPRPIIKILHAVNNFAYNCLNLQFKKYNCNSTHRPEITWLHSGEPVKESILYSDTSCDTSIFRQTEVSPIDLEFQIKSSIFYRFKRLYFSSVTFLFQHFTLTFYY